MGEATAKLSMQCKALGAYEHALTLRGAPAGPERSMAFSVPLGNTETQLFRFTHWLADKAEYKCVFRGAARGAGVGFDVVRPAVAAPPAGPDGSPCEVEVTFEPTAIGESFHDVLLLTSPTGGEYECPVVGRCIPPKPQGPIDMVKGAGSVSFKNIFARQAEFTFTVDNPAFVVKAGETVPPKKGISIAIAYKEDPSKPRTGKLSVSCPSETPSPWVFYLRA